MTIQDSSICLRHGAIGTLAAWRSCLGYIARWLPAA